MNSEKAPADDDQRPENAERQQTRVRDVEMNGVRYKSRETRQLDEDGNLLARLNELYTADGSERVFTQKEVFDPRLGLLVELLRTDYTDREPVEHEEKYRYHDRTARLSFFHYIRRLAGVKTVEQKEEYNPQTNRPEKLERQEYDPAGRPALKRVENLDPANGQLLEATADFYEDGDLILSVTETFDAAGQPLKRSSLKYESGQPAQEEVEEFEAPADSRPAAASSPPNPVFARLAPMSTAKAGARERPAETKDESPISPAVLLASFLYAKSIEDNRQPPLPPESRRTTAKSAAEHPTREVRPQTTAPTAESLADRPEAAAALPEAEVKYQRVWGPEAKPESRHPLQPEQRDPDDKDLSTKPSIDEHGRPEEALLAPQSQDQRQTAPLPPDRPPPAAEPKQTQSIKFVLVGAVIVFVLVAAYYVYSLL